MLCGPTRAVSAHLGHKLQHRGAKHATPSHTARHVSSTFLTDPLHSIGPMTTPEAKAHRVHLRPRARPRDGVSGLASRRQLRRVVSIRFEVSADGLVTRRAVQGRDWTRPAGFEFPSRPGWRSARGKTLPPPPWSTFTDAPCESTPLAPPALNGLASFLRAQLTAVTAALTRPTRPMVAVPLPLLVAVLCIAPGAPATALSGLPSPHLGTRIRARYALSAVP